MAMRFDQRDLPCECLCHAGYSENHGTNWRCGETVSVKPMETTSSVLR